MYTYLTTIEQLSYIYNFIVSGWRCSLIELFKSRVYFFKKNMYGKYYLLFFFGYFYKRLPEMEMLKLVNYYTFSYKK